MILEVNGEKFYRLFNICPLSFIENSLLFFNGKIRHSITNLPFELAVHPHNHRYSIVFDFSYQQF